MPTCVWTPTPLSSQTNACAGHTHRLLKTKNLRTKFDFGQCARSTHKARMTRARQENWFQKYDVFCALYGGVSDAGLFSPCTEDSSLMLTHSCVISYLETDMDHNPSTSHQCPESSHNLSRLHRCCVRLIFRNWPNETFRLFRYARAHTRT